jgi:hypothetical protein
MTPRQENLLRLLQRNPDGLSMVDIITITNGTQYSVVTDLRALRDEGLAGPSNFTGAGVVWAATEDLAALKAKRKAARDAEAEAAKQRAAQREATAMERAAEEAEIAGFSRPAIQRVLTQADWIGSAPTRGVASVFHMGSSLA